jgi:UTP-glucose-1-phosphate uridylyltransferase
MSGSEQVAGIVLAAGKGTRMKSEQPKALTPLLGLPLTAYVLRALHEAGVSPIIVVVGHGAEQVQAALGDGYLYALQTEQLGTGHATMQAMPHLPQGITRGSCRWGCSVGDPGGDSVTNRTPLLHRGAGDGGYHLVG